MRIILCVFLLSITSCLERNHNGGIKTKIENTDTLYKEFHANGKIKIFSKKKAGKQNGEFIRFLKNGNILQSGYYLNDEKIGLWREYNDDESVRKVLFYTKDSVLELNKTDFEFKTYENLKSGIKYVKIPIQWNTSINNDTLNILTSKKGVKTNYSPNISIKKEYIPEDTLISEYVEIVNSNHNNNKSFEILNIDKGYVDGLECYKCFSKITVKGIELGVFQAFYKKNGVIYIFSGLAEYNESYANYRALYNLIADTILFD